MSSHIKIQRADSWANNPVLVAGELALDTNTNMMKVGDGVTAWAELPVLAEGVKDKLKEKLEKMLFLKYANFRNEASGWLSWTNWMSENGITHSQPAEDHLELVFMRRKIYMPRDFADKALVLGFLP